MTLPLAPAEIRELILSTSTHQGSRRLSPMSVASLFARAVAGGASKKECAEVVGFADATMVGRFLRLLDLAPGLQEMIGWGSSAAALSFTAGVEIARLPGGVQEFVAREALRLGLTTAEIKSVVQRLQRSDATPKQAIDEVLKLRPRLDRRHVFVGRFAAPSSLQALGVMSEDDRAHVLVDLVRTVYGEAPLGARLTPTGFVLTASDNLAAAISSGEDFEGDVEKELVTRVR